MKKRLNLIFLCGIFLLGVCGCGNKDNDVDNNAPTPIRELKCDALNNVKYSFGEYFLTNDNDLYILNKNKLYSNDKNCKKLNNQTIITKLIVGRDNFVLDNSNNIYQLNGSVLKSYPYSADYTLIPNGFKSFEDNNIINQKGSYVLKNNGKLYWYEVVYTDTNKMELVLFKEYNNEIILEYDIYYNSWDGHTGYIKTDKAFYISTIINKEQCEKYADVKCEYEFVKNDELTSIYDNISIYSYSNHSYITKDGKEYRFYN